MIKILLFIISLHIIMAANAQSLLPFGMNHNLYSFDSGNAQKKWFFTKQAGITTGYSFFKGGNAGFVSVPVSIQLNRRLNDNFYAFGNVAVAPTYINFRQNFLNPAIKQSNFFYQPNKVSTFSSASLGLMYVNDEKTFSISGSIGIERNDYPGYYGRPVNNDKQNNVIRR